MECPCETCLVRIPCRTKLVKKGIYAHDYLIIEYAERCPLIVNYFGLDEFTKRPKHSHEKINKMCRIFRTTIGEVNYFVWQASTIGIY